MVWSKFSLMKTGFNLQGRSYINTEMNEREHPLIPMRSLSFWKYFQKNTRSQKMFVLYVKFNQGNCTASRFTYIYHLHFNFPLIISWNQIVYLKFNIFLYTNFLYLKNKFLVNKDFITNKKYILFIDIDKKTTSCLR